MFVGAVLAPTAASTAAPVLPTTPTFCTPLAAVEVAVPATDDISVFRAVVPAITPGMVVPSVSLTDPIVFVPVGRAASTLVESWFDAFTFAPRTFPAASCRTIRRLPFESLWSGLMLPEVMVVGLVLNCAPVSSSLPGLAAFWPSASRNPLLCPKMPTLSATAWPLIFTSSGVAALTFTLPDRTARPERGYHVSIRGAAKGAKRVS